MPDNRNFMIAIALSLAVLIGWTYFVSGPEIERARQAEIAAQQTAGQTAETQQADGIPVPGATSSSTASATGVLPTESAGGGEASRDAALAASPRLPIVTDQVTGSINLRGARLDDLRLNGYHETVDEESPTIVLLSPTGGPNAYFAEFGWQGPETAGELPGATTEWTAPAGATLTPATPVTLTYDNGAGLVFKRTITIDQDYLFTVTDSIANESGEPVALTPYGRLARLGDPPTSGYWILHEGLIGVFGDDGLKEEQYKNVAEDGEKTWTNVTEGWLGITDKYWAAALIPDKAQPFDGRFVHSGQNSLPIFQADYRQPAITIAGGEAVEHMSRLFAGAKVVSIVDGYRDTYEIKLFDRLIDWGWFWFFTKLLFLGIDYLFRLFGNFGLAILGVTLVVKALFFPLASKSYRSMSAMRKLQPEMTRIRDEYKDDKAKQQQALMELYKTEKINPLAGCWPVAIQIPVFFALYKVLFVTIEMRHAPFFGWIQDLAARDPTTIFNLFGLIPWDPPSMLMIGIWPLIMGVTMFVQMKLNPTPPDPTQAMIFTWMPVIFTFMLASFPAGLVIYWAWNNTLSVLQQYVIMRREGVDVDILGNIMGTFRRGGAATAAATAGAANGNAASKATDTAETKARAADKPAPVPVDPDRKVRPKNAPKRGKARSRAKTADKPDAQD